MRVGLEVRALFSRHFKGHIVVGSGLFCSDPTLLYA